MNDTSTPPEAIDDPTVAVNSLRDTSKLSRCRHRKVVALKRLEKHFAARLHLELAALFTWPIAAGVIVGTVVQLYHNVAHNFVYYLAGQFGVYGGPQNRLVDMGFLLLSGLSKVTWLPSNACLYILFAIAAVVGLSPLVTASIIKTPTILCVGIAWRTVLVCSLLVAFRTVSFILTVLPSPAEHCSKEAFHPPSNLYDVFFMFNTNDGCSDLIFSSHMLYGVSACMLVCRYVLLDMRLSRHQFSAKEIQWRYMLISLCCALVVGLALFIISENVHYSVDVWTAAYVVPLTWSWMGAVLPDDPLPAPSRLDTLSTTVA